MGLRRTTELAAVVSRDTWLQERWGLPYNGGNTNRYRRQLVLIWIEQWWGPC